MNLKEYILQKAEKGYCFFTSKEAIENLGGEVKQAIWRAQKHGEVATPLNGFHVIVPPEYRKIACLPPDQFIPDLMEYIDRPYYVCLLSAAQYYGAAHQRPQVFQVMTDTGRRPILCGKVRIEFITNKKIAGFPVQRFNTKQGFLNVSTPEVTALDLVTYQDKAAGIDNVFNVLIELSDKIDPKKLIALSDQKQEITWLQRLGYLFELADKPGLSTEIENFLVSRRLQRRALSPSGKVDKNTSFNEKWKLWINETIEAEI
jgi:predicted transcriptional regulator of viral defense system